MVLLALATAATSCSTNTAVVATVDGHDVPVALYNDLIDALVAHNPELKGQFEGAGQSTRNLESTLSIVTYLIDRQVIRNAADKRGTPVSAADRDAGKQQLLSRLAATPEVQAKVFASLGSATQKTLVDAEAAQIAVQKSLATGTDQETAARAVFDANKANYDQICLSVITVASEPIVALVQNRLKNGEDFAAVAKEVSIDDAKAAGGSLGCVPGSQLGNPEIQAKLASSAVGDVVGPYGQEGQRILVKLDERRPADFDSAKESIIKNLPPAGQDELSAFITSAQEAAHISVNPRFGRWDVKQLLVVPPKGPTPPGNRTATTVAPPR